MTESKTIARIKDRAEKDGIDLSSLPFITEALESITALETPVTANRMPDLTKAYRIDTHVHPVPDFLRQLSPLAAGRETPKWDVASHLKFMAKHEIKRSILCISTPQANYYPENREKTRALARILNEFVAVLVKTYPERFSFLAVTPLPNVDDAVLETQYALDELGAVGVGVLTQIEGKYPGDPAFRGFWEYLQGRESEREIVFIHPTDPVIKVDGKFVPSNPAPWRTGLGEFYFETARAIQSITMNRVIHDFPKLHWRISHGAGAFPDIAHRFLIGLPESADEARKIYATRFWYDSAGPIYPRQVKGLLASFDVPISQLVFGTDYPYGIGYWDVGTNIAGLSCTGFLSDEEKKAIFYENTQTLWKGKIDRF